MSRNQLNMTNGVFDLQKEGKIVANLTVDALMYPGIVSDNDSDRATEITLEKFLAFRRNLDPSIPINQIDIKEESNGLARSIIDALKAEGIVTQENDFHAYEIAAEEILVRRYIETREL